MIERGVARYNWHTGKWEWGEPPKESNFGYAKINPDARDELFGGVVRQSPIQNRGIEVMTWRDGLQRISLWDQ